MGSGLVLPLLRLLVVAGIGLAAMLLVLRPMVRRITAPPAPRPAALGDADAMATPSLEGPTSPVQVIADLIDRHPEASLAVLRDWLAQEAAP